MRAIFLAASCVTAFLLAGCAGSAPGSSPLERSLAVPFDRAYEASQAAIATRQFEVVHMERSAGTAALALEHWNAAARTRGRGAEVTRLSLQLTAVREGETRVEVRPDARGYAGVAGNAHARALLEEIERVLARPARGA